MTERQIIINILEDGFLIESNKWNQDEQKWNTIMDRRICTESDVLLELIKEELELRIP